MEVAPPIFTHQKVNWLITDQGLIITWLFIIGYDKVKQYQLIRTLNSASYGTMCATDFLFNLNFSFEVEDNDYFFQTFVDDLLFDESGTNRPWVNIFSCSKWSSALRRMLSFSLRR